MEFKNPYKEIEPKRRNFEKQNVSHEIFQKENHTHVASPHLEHETGHSYLCLVHAPCLANDLVRDYRAHMSVVPRLLSIVIFFQTNYCLTANMVVLLQDQKPLGDELYTAVDGKETNKSCLQFSFLTIIEFNRDHHSGEGNKNRCVYVCASMYVRVFASV